MNLEQLGWDISHIRGNGRLREPEFGVPERVKRTAYPFRLMRYWFVHNLLVEEARRRGRPLRVCEVGVDTGQMLAYTASTLALRGGDVRDVARSWLAVDALVREDRLRAAGYTEFMQADVEGPSFGLPGGHDVVICLHVLEHLFEAEAAFARLCAGLADGGVIMGGNPVLPGFLRGIRQRKLRRKAARLGHVTAISPGWLKAAARDSGLDLEFCAGAFFLRSGGRPVENSALWFRLNLLFGAAFPSWPGEVYWAMRRRAALDSHARL